jgi:CRP-like cAMP-binding protein
VVTFAKSAGESLLETELEQLRTVLQPVRVQAGARLFEQGDAGDRMLLISEGQACSSIRLPDGSEQPLSHAGGGEVVGEIALLTGARRTATVSAVTPLRGWTLDRHGFDVLRWDPRGAAIDLVQRLLALTTARLRACCTELGRPVCDRGDSPVVRPGSIRHLVAMPSVEYLASLLCFAKFAQLEDVDAVVRHVPVRAVQRGEFLIEEDRRPPCLLLVARGAVEVTVRQGAATHRVRLAGPGRFVGHNGILDKGSSPVVARSRERSVLLAFPRERIVSLLADPSRLARAFSAALLEDTARAVREASRPVASTTPRDSHRRLR